MLTIILKEALLGSFSSIKNIIMIVIPIMIAMEILKDSGIFEKIADLFSPLVKIFGMKKESGFPLVIGILIGISYGAGVIFETAKQENLPERDLYLLTYFLVACHAIIEDTAIFTAIGANGALLLITRLFVASLFTFLASRIIKDKNKIKMSAEV
ncbi:MAG TPA: nucleoside recognition protein [Thermoanaerobacterales bacterium]|nr:nucleoside recognition protein [Thermoanaerobacterales bacterium]